ncbi:Fic family protein [Robbsia andropogonis]|uniref:Fic family protein n=1 Tax=Robbsia andropogonis TaxID=28092 RepID=UPI0020A05D05|nr:Fic family protein [Robbsia andropogonis]MCP1117420.1 Fic family protein [Robbsia andropogonis]MCP1126886.1 Fic family protein [Robbsia andropogonis]
MENAIGYRWLANRYGIAATQPYSVESNIGPTRRTTRHDKTVHETYTPVMRPSDTLSAHLTFALKHEGIFLELLARLFQAIPVPEFVDWIMGERTGQYARRAGFLYEWLTGRQLDGVPAVPGGGYVDAIDPEKYIVGTRPENNKRWHVRDNLPGTRTFCPLVRRTNHVNAAQAYDIAAQLDALQVEYGVDTLRRSAVWLTLKESRASFQIEHEQDRKDRIKRFAEVMESRIGVYDRPLARETLADLQREIIGERTTITRFGLRESPVFVGAIEHFRDVIHYIAPHWNDVDRMLDGLETFLTRTEGASPIARAAVLAFGFVYIHPFADGNGRIHRFLINDLLRRDGAVPAPFVLPVSAAITSRAQNMAAYDAVLEVFSKPFMRHYGAFSAFDTPRRFPDGVTSSFAFDAYADAQHAWRYPDLTAHVEYLAELIDRTIRMEMRREAQLMQGWSNARSGVKDILDGPNSDIDRIIRSVKNNNWTLSNKLRMEFPIMDRENLAEPIIAAVRAAFEAMDHSAEDDRES